MSQNNLTNLPLIPFGKLLNSYLDYNIEIAYAIYIFVGKHSILEASKMIERGQVALALPHDKQVSDFKWPVLKKLRLILFTTQHIESDVLERMSYELLERGAKQICVFYGDDRPVEIFNE